MKFKTGELAFTASILEVRDEPSAQTGAPLKWLTIQFRAQSDEMHELALAAASERSRGGVFSVSEAAGEPELEWRVADSSVQFVGNAPWGVNHHTWVIQQVERVACSSLLIGDLTLEPYDYREEVATDGALRLAARCAASDADLAKISELMQSRAQLDAVRVGISDQSRQMVVADYAWGPGVNGQAVVVVLEEQAERRVSLGASPSVDHELTSALLALLSADDIHALRDRQHATRRVNDIDAWEL